MIWKKLGRVRKSVLDGLIILSVFGIVIMGLLSVGAFTYTIYLGFKELSAEQLSAALS